jgi:hypothetical protein
VPIELSQNAKLTVLVKCSPRLVDCIVLYLLVLEAFVLSSATGICRKNLLIDFTKHQRNNPLVSLYKKHTDPRISKLNDWIESSATLVASCYSNSDADVSVVSARNI